MQRRLEAMRARIQFDREFGDLLITAEHTILAGAAATKTPTKVSTIPEAATMSTDAASDVRACD